MRGQRRKKKREEEKGAPLSARPVSATKKKTPTVAIVHCQVVPGCEKAIPRRCSPAWSCTPRRCDSSTAFQASRTALCLPSSVDARCLVLRRISSSTRLANAATPRKATTAKSAGSSPNFPMICARVCALCRVVCVRWCRVVCHYKYYSMGGRKILCGGAAPRSCATPPETYAKIPTQ